MAEEYYVKSSSPITPIDAPPVIPPPLVIWGPGDPRPTVPIAGWDPATGGWPEPPPTEELPDGIWGPDDPRPTVPIAEPPWGWGGKPPEPPEVPGFKVTYIWTAETGWMTIIIPTGPTVTPSKRK
jgi:hypothetical protein